MLQEDDNPPNAVPEEVLSTGSNQTAKQAVQILIDKNIGFVLPTSAQRKNLLVAFAGKNMVVYGKAFDILKISGTVNLDNVADIERNLGNIMFYEIKSTNRDLDDDFKRYFFALTTAELLVAQSLKNH